MSLFSSKKETKYLYFILMEDLPVSERVFPAGNIATVAEAEYLKEMQSEPLEPGLRLKVHLVEADVFLALEVGSLRELSEQDAGLLQAVSPSALRLDLYLDKQALESARRIRVTQPVTVDYNCQSLSGIVKYIGNICDSPPLSGTFFGIELQGDAEGQNDGEFGKTRYFHCKKDRGIFVAFNKVQAGWSSGAAGQYPSTRGVKTNPPAGDYPVIPGDRVSIYVEEELKEGTVVGISEVDSTVLVSFGMDPVTGKEQEWTVPLESVVKEDMLQPSRTIQRTTCESHASEQEEVYRNPPLGFGRLARPKHCLEAQWVPSCFIIQMPRFGKNYKMFEKIIPSMELDISDLLCDSPRECCLCGVLATLECDECFRDKLFSKTGLKQYCDTCWCQVHSHLARRSHKSTKLMCPAEYLRSPKVMVPREKMQLFAVLCIETSHYVSFIKYGAEDHHWMFFDSMSDRHGGESGYNIPTVTACPEVAQYVKSPAAKLAKQRPRDMEGVAKRQFCDAYMYLYQNPRMAVYK
uniref:ubiquitin carboxyl-terminal hydrolase CYLD-like n=1 Tax=Pristiophorus japonicus TaxID=55135 RepID=UPI00398EB93D